VRPSRLKTLGELRIVRERFGQQLQRNEAIEVRLARLEDEAHRAAANQLDDFAIEGMPPRAFRVKELRGRRRLRLRRSGLGQHAFWAKPLRRFGRHRRAAFRTGVR